MLLHHPLRTTAHDSFTAAARLPAQTDELAKFKALKAKLQEEAAAKTAAQRAAITPKPSKPSSSTPTSLDETATPNERALFGKLKQHDNKFDGLFQQVRARSPPRLLTPLCRHLRAALTAAFLVCLPPPTCRRPHAAAHASVTLAARPHLSCSWRARSALKLLCGVRPRLVRAQGEAGFGKADEEYKKADEERLKAEADRKKRAEERLADEEKAIEEMEKAREKEGKEMEKAREKEGKELLAKK
jgi:hypothetical protein